MDSEKVKPMDSAKVKLKKPPSVWGESQATRLEFTGGKSNKFWEVTVVGANVCTHWGRIGFEAQSFGRNCGTHEEATFFAKKLIQQKLAKGYVLITVSTILSTTKPLTPQKPVTVKPNSSFWESSNPIYAPHMPVGPTPVGPPASWPVGFRGPPNSTFKPDNSGFSPHVPAKPTHKPPVSQSVTVEFVVSVNNIETVRSVCKAVPALLSGNVVDVPTSSYDDLFKVYTSLKNVFESQANSIEIPID